MVIAKPIVNNKFWILQEDNRKVGTVEHDRNGFVVRYNDKQAEFKTIKTLKNATKISFEDSIKREKQFENQVNGFPTNSKPYNAVYNVKERLPIFTKKNKSKSWYAAGYYQITINGKTTIEFCPKLILLQRYPHIGPVRTPDGFVYK